MLKQIEDLVHQHEAWRSECLNLIASENVAGPKVRQFSGGDLEGRYGDYTGRDLTARWYFGTHFVVEIEKLVTDLARQVFKAQFIEFRALSGHVAGAAAIMAFTEPGDCVLEVGRDGGGHRLAEKLTHASLAKLDVRFLPIDQENYTIDVPRAIHLIREARPKLVILGSSNFLFPHPVRELSSALAEFVPGAILAYDASHVLGLIAGGRFQDPLREGAALMLGSTHKTLPGPQGGILLSNDEAVISRVSEACYPGLVGNHHLTRSPSLGVALLEMLEFGEEYAGTVIRNAKALASALKLHGCSPAGEARGFTESHTVLVRCPGTGDGREAARRLEACNVIVTAAILDGAQKANGLRLGVQELTRLGGDGAFFGEVGRLLADILCERIPVDDARQRATGLRRALPGLRYVFTS